MKINGNSAMNPVQKGTLSISEDAKESLHGFEKGQEIEGIIREVSDKITIDFSGRELKFPKGTVQNATEGDIKKFKVMEVSGKSIVLKEINGTRKGMAGPILSTKVETDRMIFSEGLKEKGDKEEDSVEPDKLADKITEEDYYAASQELMPLEEYNLERLERAIERIKYQKAVKHDVIQEQKSRINKQRNELESAGAKELASEAGITGVIAEKLIEADLPVTKENVKSMVRAMKMSESIHSISENAKAYVIENGLEPTIKNLYKAIHSGIKKTEPISDEAWEQLKEAAGKVIESAGYEVNEESLKEARWLLDNNLPLNKENYAYKKILDNIGEGDLNEAFLEQAAAAAGSGALPEEADITLPGRGEIKRLVNEWSKISDKALLRTLKKSKEDADINLNNLMSEQDLMDEEERLSGVRIIEETASEPEYDIRGITAKRRLEEIRLKLTAESGIRLSMKGIHIGTEPIERIVEGLKDLEDAYYKSLMKEADKLAGEEEIRLLKETSQELNELRSSPASLLSLTFSRRNMITVGSLATEGTYLKAGHGMAENAYETVMTVPRKDLGDSIQKAFRNIDNILEDLKLETTEANQRAVRILSYNNMELNIENIVTMKEYDAEVNAMLSSMRPAVTAELIKRGINPLDMTVSELREQAESVGREISTDEEEKYSEFLYRMDKQGGLTEGERDAYVGIYRLIHQVNKTDGAAIGSVVKAGMELTLSNLLTAVRTNKGIGIDKKIDDGFGYLSQINKAGKSITEQINTGIHSVEYGKLLLKKVEDNLNPVKLHEISKDSSLTEIPIEMLSDMLDNETEVFEEKERYKERYEILNKILADSKQETSFLRSMGIEDSISMIEASKKLVESDSGIYEEIRKSFKKSRDIEKSETNDSDIEGLMKRFSNEAVKSFENDRMIRETCKKYLDEIDEQIDTNKAMDTDLEQLELLRSASRSIRLINALAEKECYEIPIVTQNGIASMNVTFVQSHNGSRGLKISLDNIHGKLNVDFTVKEDEAVLNISAENAAGLDEAKSKEERIKEAAGKSGFLLKQINYNIKHGNEIYEAYKTYQNRPDHSTEQTFINREEDRDETEGTNALYILAGSMVHAYLD